MSFASLVVGGLWAVTFSIVLVSIAGLFFCIALLLFQYVSEAKLPVRERLLRIGEFLVASRNRLIVWAVALIGALAPNHSGLMKGACSGMPVDSTCDAWVSAPFLNTAASIVLISFCGVITGIPSIYRHIIEAKQRAIPIILTGAIGLLLVVISVCYIGWSNQSDEGVAVPWDIFKFSFIVALGSAIILEMWLARVRVDENLREEQRRARTCC